MISDTIREALTKAAPLFGSAVAAVVGVLLLSVAIHKCAPMAWRALVPDRHVDWRVPLPALVLVAAVGLVGVFLCLTLL